MIDATLLFEKKADRIYHILSKPGDWKYERTEGEFKSTKYIFSRESTKSPGKRVELAITSNTLQTKVFDITPAMNQKLDLSQLEAFCNQ